MRARSRALSSVDVAVNPGPSMFFRGKPTTSCSIQNSRAVRTTWTRMWPRTQTWGTNSHGRAGNGRGSWRRLRNFNCHWRQGPCLPKGSPHEPFDPPLCGGAARPGHADADVFVRPLFFEGPFRASDLLSRATTKLASDLRQWLDKLGKNPRHDDLADGRSPRISTNTTSRSRWTCGDHTRPSARWS